MKIFLRNSLWLTLVFFLGCMTYNFRTENIAINRVSQDFPAAHSGEGKDWTKLERRIAQEGRALIGRSSLSFPEQSFNFDCTGVVLANYYQSGLSLWPLVSEYSGGGVERLYGWLEAEGLLFNEPRLGDLIFWDNTYDSNNDYDWNDPLTHVGVVVDISPEGQITYIHHNYRRGIEDAQMNLLKPDLHREGEYLVNSPMRMAYADRPRAEKWLSSHLFRAFGRPSLILNKLDQ
jgi:hypothetical protein